MSMEKKGKEGERWCHVEEMLLECWGPVTGWNISSETWKREWTLTWVARMSTTWGKSQHNESCWSRKKTCCWPIGEWKRYRLWSYNLLKEDKWPEKAATCPEVGKEEAVSFNIKQSVPGSKGWEGEWWKECKYLIRWCCVKVEAVERNREEGRQRRGMWPGPSLDLAKFHPLPSWQKLRNFFLLHSRLSLMFLTTLHRLLLTFLLLQ